MKQKEINQLSIEQIEVELNNLNSRYSKLKTMHSVTPLENPLELRILRRTIARLSTQLSSKKLIN